MGQAAVFLIFIAPLNNPLNRQFMKFYNKIKWVLGILLVFALIVTTNLVDRRNFLRVKEAVTAMYEDRLLAKGLIFDALAMLQEKELAVERADKTFFLSRNTEVNQELAALLQSFGETRLTQEEQHVFMNFKKHVEQLKSLESGFVASGLSQKEALLKHLGHSKGYLHKLSAIQLSEGRRQLAITEKAVDSVEFYTQVEIYILIFLAIAVQMVVIYTPKKR